MSLPNTLRKVVVVQCGKCGVPIGVADPGIVEALQNNLEQRIKQGFEAVHTDLQMKVRNLAGELDTIKARLGGLVK